MQEPTRLNSGEGRRRWGRRNDTRTRRSCRGSGEGIPQGAPISPLLSNLYMRRFILGWKVLGHERRLGAHIVNYADDFVICCRGNASAALEVMRAMMERLGRAVNEDKAGICRLPAESVTFPGYAIRRCYSKQTGRAYVGTRPSNKSVRRVTPAVIFAVSGRARLSPR